MASLAPVLWATNIVASRVIVTSGVHPFALTALRWLLAGILLYAYAALTVGRPRFTLGLLALGVLGITGFSDLLYLSLRFAPASLVAIIIGLVPVATLLLAWLMRMERLDALLVSAALLGFLGVYLIEYEGLRLDPGSGIGALIALASVAVWAVYTVWSKRVVAGEHPIRVLAASTLSVAPVNFAIAAPFLAGSIAALSSKPPILLLLVYVAVAPGFIAYLAWLTAVKIIGAASTNIYVNLLPLAALLLSVALLGESLEPLQWIGAALVIASAFITGYRESLRIRSRGGP